MLDKFSNLWQLVWLTLRRKRAICISRRQLSRIIETERDGGRGLPRLCECTSSSSPAGVARLDGESKVATVARSSTLSATDVRVRAEILRFAKLVASTWILTSRPRGKRLALLTSRAHPIDALADSHGGLSCRISRLNRGFRRTKDVSRVRST